jgi:hypothetical protein
MPGAGGKGCERGAYSWSMSGGRAGAAPANRRASRQRHRPRAADCKAVRAARRQRRRRGLHRPPLSPAHRSATGNLVGFPLGHPLSASAKAMTQRGALSAGPVLDRGLDPRAFAFTAPLAAEQPGDAAPRRYPGTSRRQGSQCAGSVRASCQPPVACALGRSDH